MERDGRRHLSPDRRSRLKRTARGVAVVLALGAGAVAKNHLDHQKPISDCNNPAGRPYVAGPSGNYDVPLEPCKPGVPGTIFRYYRNMRP